MTETHKKPQVLNAHVVGTKRPGAHYCGRPSPFGNPFTIGKDGDRDEVIGKWINYLHDNPELVARMRRELVGLDLICWCAPRECHCDTTLIIANGGDLPPRWEPSKPSQGAFDF